MVSAPIREEAGVKEECYPLPLQMSSEEAMNTLTKVSCLPQS